MCIAVMCVLQLLQIHMHVCISLSQNIEENNVPLSVPEKYQKLLIKTSIAHIISAFSTYSFQSNESIDCLLQLFGSGSTNFTFIINGF